MKFAMNVRKKRINDYPHGNLLIDYFRKQVLKINFDLPRTFIIYFIKFYRNYLSPLLPASCRFYPSCSAYAEDSFIKLGFWKGSYFTLVRLFKCNPFHPGGYDPVIDDDYYNYKKNCENNH